MCMEDQGLGPWGKVMAKTSPGPQGAAIQVLGETDNKHIHALTNKVHKGLMSVVEKL